VKRKLTRCFQRARREAIRDPRNNKEYYTRILADRLEKIIKRRYGLDYYLEQTN